MGSLGPTPKSKITSSQITALNGLLASTGHSLLTPADADPAAYTATLARWSAAAQKPAGASLVPTAVEPVQIAVKYAAENDLDLAVKGGGHSTAGVSSTNGGLLIDLSSMRGVSVDASRKLVTVQGGATWSDVDVKAYEYGLACVGGTVADTGVGGLTLGGGYGWLSGRVGLVIDNLVSVKLVLADGSVVTASKSESPELFWALRGAGQNFGVAVEFVYQGHSIDKESYGGMLMFHPTKENIEAVVKVANELYEPEGGKGKGKMAGRGAGGIALGRPPLPAEVVGEANVGKTLLLVPVIYHGTEEEAKSVLKGFFDLKPVFSTAAMVTYPTLNHILDVPPGLRVSMKGASFTLPIKPAFVESILASFDKFIDGYADAARSLVLWELYDPSKVAEGENGDMAFANRGMHFNGMIAPIWTDAGADGMCRQWARDAAEMFKAELAKAGEEAGKSGAVKGDWGASMLYGNYDQYDEKAKDVFGNNYAKLQKLKAQYDPTNTFNKLFAVTPQA